MTSQQGLYAYALVGKSPQHLDILGIDKKNKIYPLEAGDICIMVSKIEINDFQNQVKKLYSELTNSAGTAQNGTEEILRTHEDVVSTLMQSTTIVPFRFGTILKDETAISKMLHDDDEKFKKLLAKFSGKAEWGLKVYADNQEFIKYIVQVEPRFKTLAEQREKLSKGAAYLLGRKMEEELKDNALARLAEVTAVIFQELAKAAYEAKLNKTLPQKLTGKKKDMILNTVYLVEKEKAAHFCDQGKRLIQQYAPQGLDLEVSGPWPPYSFV